MPDSRGLKVIPTADCPRQDLTERTNHAALGDIGLRHPGRETRKDRRRKEYAAPADLKGERAGLPALAHTTRTIPSKIASAAAASAPLAMRPKCLPPSSCSPSRRLNARHLLVNRSVRLRVDAGGAAGGGDVLLSSGLLPSAPYALFAALCSLGVRWFSS